MNNQKSDENCKSDVALPKKTSDPFLGSASSLQLVGTGESTSDMSSLGDSHSVLQEFSKPQTPSIGLWLTSPEYKFDDEPELAFDDASSGDLSRLDVLSTPRFKSRSPNSLSTTSAGDNSSGSDASLDPQHVKPLADISASPVECDSTQAVNQPHKDSPGQCATLTPTSSQQGRLPAVPEASPRTLLLYEDISSGLGTPAFATRRDEPGLTSPSEVTYKNISKTLIGRQGLSPSSSAVRKVSFSPSPNMKNATMPPPETPPYRAARKMSFTSPAHSRVSTRLHMPESSASEKRRDSPAVRSLSLAPDESEQQSDASGPTSPFIPIFESDDTKSPGDFGVQTPNYDVTSRDDSRVNATKKSEITQNYSQQVSNQTNESLMQPQFTNQCYAKNDANFGETQVNCDSSSPAGQFSRQGDQRLPYMYPSTNCYNWQNSNAYVSQGLNTTQSYMSTNRDMSANLYQAIQGFQSETAPTPKPISGFDYNKDMNHDGYFVSNVPISQTRSNNQGLAQVHFSTAHGNTSAFMSGSTQKYSDTGQTFAPKPSYNYFPPQTMNSFFNSMNSNGRANTTDIHSDRGGYSQANSRSAPTLTTQSYTPYQDARNSHTVASAVCSPTTSIPRHMNAQRTEINSPGFTASPDLQYGGFRENKWPFLNSRDPFMCPPMVRSSTGAQISNSNHTLSAAQCQGFLGLLQGTNPLWTARDVIVARNLNTRPARLPPPPLSKVNRQAHKAQFVESKPAVASAAQSPVVASQYLGAHYSQSPTDFINRTGDQRHMPLQHGNSGWTQLQNMYYNDTLYQNSTGNSYGGNVIPGTITNPPVANQSVTYQQYGLSSDQGNMPANNTNIRYDSTNWNSNGGSLLFDSNPYRNEFDDIIGIQAPPANDIPDVDAIPATLNTYTGDNRLMELAVAAQALEQRDMDGGSSPRSPDRLNDVARIPDVTTPPRGVPQTSATILSGQKQPYSDPVEVPPNVAVLPRSSHHSGDTPKVTTCHYPSQNLESYLTAAHDPITTEYQRSCQPEKRKNYQGAFDSANTMTQVEMSTPQCDDTILATFPMMREIDSNVKYAYDMHDQQFRDFMANRQDSQQDSKAAHLRSSLNHNQDKTPPVCPLNSTRPTPCLSQGRFNPTEIQRSFTSTIRKTAKEPEPATPLPVPHKKATRMRKTSPTQKELCKNIASPAPPFEFGDCTVNKSTVVLPPSRVDVNPAAFVNKGDRAPKPRHFLVKKVTIGEFKALPAQGGRVKLMFSKSTLVYEFESLAFARDAPEADMVPFACIEVTFRSICGLKKIGANELLVELETPPRIFAGTQNTQVIGRVASSRVTRYNRRSQVDITDGEIYKCPYHKLEFFDGGPVRLLASLIEFDRRFDTILQCPLIWDTNKVFDLTLKRTTGKKHERTCDCEEGCFGASCVCATGMELCGLKCKCTSKYATCRNPIKSLLENDVSLWSARNDRCFMDNFYKFPNLGTILQQRLHFSCCDKYIPIKDCVPGKFPCPGAPKCSKMYTYSWCEAKLHDEGISPRNHCAECKRCVHFEAMHCRSCGKCYLPKPTQLVCPCMLVTSDHLTGHTNTSFSSHSGGECQVLNIPVSGKGCGPTDSSSSSENSHIGKPDIDLTQTPRLDPSFSISTHSASTSFAGGCATGLTRAQTMTSASTYSGVYSTARAPVRAASLSVVSTLGTTVSSTVGPPSFLPVHPALRAKYEEYNRMYGTPTITLHSTSASISPIPFFIPATPLYSTPRYQTPRPNYQPKELSSSQSTTDSACSDVILASGPADMSFPMDLSCRNYRSISPTSMPAGGQQLVSPESKGLKDTDSNSNEKTPDEVPHSSSTEVNPSASPNDGDLFDGKESEQVSAGTALSVNAAKLSSVPGLEQNGSFSSPRLRSLYNMDIKDTTSAHVESHDRNINSSTSVKYNLRPNRSPGRSPEIRQQLAPFRKRKRGKQATKKTSKSKKKAKNSGYEAKRSESDGMNSQEDLSTKSALPEIVSMQTEPSSNDFEQDKSVFQIFERKSLVCLPRLL